MITIITPTIGRPVFRETLESINQQTVLRKTQIHHYIVVDNAPDNLAKTEQVINLVEPHVNLKRFIIPLPFQSGADKYNGHKIYASIPQLVETTYTAFLDDDNILQPNHFEVCRTMLKKKDLDWCFTLRTCFDDAPDHPEIPDYSESLGHISHHLSNPDYYLIDTNLYFMKTEVVKQTCHVWNRRLNYDLNDSDKVFARVLMANFPKYDCTRQYTVRYRLNWGQYEFFQKSNAMTDTVYKHQEHITKPTLYLVHFSEEHTEKVIRRLYFQTTPDEASIGFKQYQMNLVDRLKDKFFIKSAYHTPYIPSGSNVLVHAWNMNLMPQNVLARKDLNKVLYTTEPPSFRHQEQWDTEFLKAYFTKIISFWSDIDFPRAYFPFCHQLDMTNPLDLALIQENEAPQGEYSACICLENRPFKDFYTVNGVKLKAMDNMRHVLVTQISKIMPVHCYGQTWKQEDFKVFPNVHCHQTPSRYLDQDAPIDYYKKHTFTIVTENCNAKGWVSEKMIDAIMVGSIPIYLGNIDDQYLDHIGRDIPIYDMIVLASQTARLRDPAFVETRRRNIEVYKHKLLEKLSITAYNRFLADLFEEPQPIYYSQFGEDKHIYNKYFKDAPLKGEGVFFEAGAMCGHKWSNTKFFEDHLGWSGILVEPNMWQAKKLRQNRGDNPKNKIFEALISDSTTPLSFVTLPEAHCAVSCISDTMPEGHQETYINQVPHTMQCMETRSLTSIIQESGFERIDFFSLDVEGHELNVLRSFDFSIPIRLVLIENLHNTTSDQEARALLESHGFVYQERFELNDIYLHRDFL